MATYGQLSLGSGGGVIDPNKQSPRQEGATLIIGLGGTGGKAVQMIKREVYRQLRPDEGSDVPKYDNIRYLIIDTDPSDYSAHSSNPADIDSQREFFNISYPAIARDFDKSNWAQLKANKAYSWLNYENIKPQTAVAGAGGIRQIGRYLLVKNVSNLYTKLKNEITLARKAAGTTSIKVKVHICAGISGGTGSGTFLDVCYLIRKAMIDLGVSGEQICGYFFLPDVNLTMPEIMNDSTAQSYISVNGYAALQELDYCMNFDKNHDSFKMDYGSGLKIDNANSPVDLCYLISASDKNGAILKNGYSYAMHVVTDHVINFLSKVELPDGVKADEDNGGLTLEGHIANIRKKLDVTEIQSGAVVDYNILGSAVAEMPLTEIATYIGVKLFENIDGVYNKVPTKAERDGFQSNVLKMRYEDIYREALKECASEIPFGKKHDGALLRDSGIGQFNELHNATYDHNCGLMERNIKAMMEDLGDYKTDATGSGTSLISRLYKELYERCVLDINYGPFYAKRMLYGENNENIYNAVVGMIEENREKRKSEQIQEDLLRDEVETAKEKAKKAHLLNANSCADNLKAALSAYCLHMTKLTAFDKIEKVLTRFRDQISELDSKLFKVLVGIMETLRETFKENARVFSEGIQDDNQYIWKILKVTEVKEQLDPIIQDMDVKKVLYDMMQNIFSKVDKWTEKQDDNELSRMISGFILDEFKDATQKTMTDYLYIKYNASTLQQLSDSIDQDIMQEKLWNRSNPMFWKTPSYDDQKIGHLTTLSIPFNSLPIEKASERIREQGANVRKTGLIDRLSLMRFLSGIPIYAYNGLEQLELAYEGSSNKYGRHLFERDIDWNNLLPSPIPFSVNCEGSGRQVEKGRGIKALWDKAKEDGIIEEDQSNHWYIKQLKNVNLIELEKEASLIADNSVTGLAEFGKKLEDVKKLAYASQTEIKIDISNVEGGYEEAATIDFLIKAPKLVEVLKEEMQLRDALNNLIAETDSKRMKAMGNINLKSDFFNAIFTGVIKHEPLLVKYVHSNYGIEEEFVLSNPEMKYGRSATYQAFLTFSDLKPEIRDSIIEEAKKALTSDAPEVVARTHEAMDFISSKLELLVNTAYRTHASLIEVKDEVDEFYKDFMKEYNEFRIYHV